MLCPVCKCLTYENTQSNVNVSRMRIRNLLYFVMPGFEEEYAILENKFRPAVDGVSLQLHLLFTTTTSAIHFD